VVSACRAVTFDQAMVRESMALCSKRQQRSRCEYACQEEEHIPACLVDQESSLQLSFCFEFICSTHTSPLYEDEQSVNAHYLLPAFHKV
jgi:hypothetical protein